jgi:hypothetical protein
MGKRWKSEAVPHSTADQFRVQLRVTANVWWAKDGRFARLSPTCTRCFGFNGASRRLIFYDASDKLRYCEYYMYDTYSRKIMRSIKNATALKMLIQSLASFTNRDDFRNESAIASADPANVIGKQTDAAE